MKRIMIITGSRADYGKIKNIAIKINKNKNLKLYMYITGMHLLKQFGKTYRNIIKDGFKTIKLSKKIPETLTMDEAISKNIIYMSKYVKKIKPHMIIIHGDRLEALAGAIVGMFNNIYVAHIEGGEVSGTVDEKIRHAISKISNFHFVSNEKAKNRLIQMGEEESKIFVVGSPDIDIMLSNNLPNIKDVKKKYNIDFQKYGICICHPVTTEYEKIRNNIKILINCLTNTEHNYIVIYPNNDMGSEIIIEEYKKIKNNNKFKFFKSIEFEDFLTLLKACDFVIGNSSVGIRECGVYGIPSINLGSRQHNRADMNRQHNIQTIERYNVQDIINAINNNEMYKMSDNYFGNGHSSEEIEKILNKKDIWNASIQKIFKDIK